MYGNQKPRNFLDHFPRETHERLSFDRRVSLLVEMIPFGKQNIAIENDHL